MQNKEQFASWGAKNSYSLVYFYLLAGCGLLAATFLLLPRFT